MLPLEVVEQARRAVAPEVSGKLRKVVGSRLEVEGVNGAIGELMRILPPGPTLSAEVVALDDDALVCVPLGWPTGLQRGQRAVMTGSRLSVPVGEGLLGRVIDGLGRPIDGRPLPLGMSSAPVIAPAPQALSRRPVDQPLALGVKAIDTLLTCGKGQRVGLFAGSGVGKSTMLGMLAKGTKADCAVIALVGERGREAEEFVREHLGGGAGRSVVVVATSDEPPLVRLRSAMTATAIAEWFREQGADVLLLMDSLTRFAMAQREVGLAAGEPPATRGYPPSVFSALAGLLERAGTSEAGSITGVYTVLVEGDDMNEPVADASRAILDGHIVLSREIAEMGRYPAIDVLASVSRLSDDLCSPEQLALAAKARRLMAVWAEVKDLVEVGAYRSGSSPEADEAIAKRGALEAFLAQAADEQVPVERAWEELRLALEGGSR